MGSFGGFFSNADACKWKKPHPLVIVFFTTKHGLNYVEKTLNICNLYDKDDKFGYEKHIHVGVLTKK